MLQKACVFVIFFAISFAGISAHAKIHRVRHIRHHRHYRIVRLHADYFGIARHHRYARNARHLRRYAKHQRRHKGYQHVAYYKTTKVRVTPDYF